MAETDYRGVFLVGLMHPEGKAYRSILDNLERRFGPILESGEEYEFHYTDYYAEEMGDELVRHWHVFESLILQSAIADHKRTAMRLEEQFERVDGERWFNIDVGYVSGAKLVLASHKNNSHRIYLRDGVFAEVTLRYEQGQWRTMPWTFPDFQDLDQHGWLDQAREHWVEAID